MAEDSLAKVVGRTHFLYTQYLNRLPGPSGLLWQNRFLSKLEHALGSRLRPLPIRRPKG